MYYGGMGYGHVATSVSARIREDAEDLISILDGCPIFDRGYRSKRVYYLDHQLFDEIYSYVTEYQKTSKMVLDFALRRFSPGVVDEIIPIIKQCPPSCTDVYTYVNECRKKSKKDLVSKFMFRRALLRISNRK
jgi:hypothetical protein